MIEVGLLNCRSVVNKALKIKDHIVDNDFDVFAINESWLSSSLDDPDSKEVTLPGKSCKDKHVIKSLVPTGYKFLHLPRNGRGGGNTIIYKECIDIKPQHSKIYSSFDQIMLERSRF